jgi:hypothetical protein
MDANIMSSSSKSSGGDEDLLSSLPSEQDRKATMGCLAAVLNIMFTARQRVDNVDKKSSSTTSPSRDYSSASLKSQPDNSQEDEDITSDISNFSFREDDDELHDNVEQQKSMQRAKSFQRELLKISAELLLLSPDHAKVFLPNLDIVCTDAKMEQELLLQPFLQSFSNSTESFRCIAFLMLRFLLLSGAEEKTNQDESAATSTSALEKMTIVGYDARVRYTFKSLAVSILSYWQMQDHGDFMSEQTASAFASRKFEALEDLIALRISMLSQEMKNNKNSLTGQKKQTTLKQNIGRGLKIGAAGVAAGTIFAITGGLAAPAIVGGIAAITGASSAAVVIATVLLLPAATTIFGVGGGTLVASKMSKRTAGLEEFDIVKVITDENSKAGTCINKNEPPELSRTLCISGWLKDEHDFERPFGITPRKLDDPHEILCRFCSVYQSEMIPHCNEILKEWQGKENELFDLCQSSYGKDPRALLPFDKGPRFDAKLVDYETRAVDKLLTTLGLPLPTHAKPSPKENFLPPTVNLLADVLTPSNKDTSNKEISSTLLRSFKVWDFNANYGSELYIVQWESKLLLDLYGSAREFQKDLAKKAAEEALKKTALATLMAAVFVPSVLVSLSNIIDAKWTLAMERADEAGILLAHSLLNSNAGHRPVSLVGFSFGARMIIACLKELARYQVIWVNQQQEMTKDQDRGSMIASFRKKSMKQNNQHETLRHREPASIVEDVILMGTPASVNKTTWDSCRGVVAGRLVNCHSNKDMILALMYRAKNLTSALLNPPVGIQEVKAAGIENFDVSHLVASHGEYNVAVNEILHLVGYDQPR